MNQEKQKKFLLAIAYYGVIITGIFLGFRFLFQPLLPFIIGFLIAWLLKRPALWLAGKLHIPHKIPAALLTAVFYTLIIGLLIFAGTQLISALKDLVQMLPDICSNQLLPFIDRCMNALENFMEQFDPTISAQIDTWVLEMSSSVSEMITAISSAVLKIISGIAAKAPTLILRIVLTVISTFYFSFDFDRITAFFIRILPKKLKDTVLPIRNKTISSVKIFLRSYCLIFLLTAAELSLGFLILGIPYPAILGVLVAVVDLMPILGTGLILLPWVLIMAFTGNIPFALGMLLLYVTITVIRNIVEPKLVGRQIGLHPLATLISMFVGLQLFGIVGMFILPVTLSILVQFHRDEILPVPGWVNKDKNTES